VGPSSQTLPLRVRVDGYIGYSNLVATGAGNGYVACGDKCAGQVGGA
jgi:hypothetical protein